MSAARFPLDCFLDRCTLIEVAEHFVDGRCRDPRRNAHVSQFALDTQPTVTLDRNRGSGIRTRCSGIVERARFVKPIERRSNFAFVVAQVNKCGEEISCRALAPSEQADCSFVGRL